MWIIAIHEGNYGIKYLVTKAISTRRSGIWCRAQRRERNSFFSSRTKERPSPSGGFSPRVEFARYVSRYAHAPLTFILGELIALGHTHSTTAGTRTIALNDACCQGAVALPCLHCPRVRHVFAPRQTKAFRDGQETGLPRTRFKPGLAKVVRETCHFSPLFLSSRCLP